MDQPTGRERQTLSNSVAAGAVFDATEVKSCVDIHDETRKAST